MSLLPDRPFLPTLTVQLCGAGEMQGLQHCPSSNPHPLATRTRATDLRRESRSSAMESVLWAATCSGVLICECLRGGRGTGRGSAPGILSLKKGFDSPLKKKKMNTEVAGSFRKRLKWFPGEVPMPSGQQQPRRKPTMVHRICGSRSQNAVFSKGSWGHTSLANRSAKYQA